MPSCFVDSVQPGSSGTISYPCPIQGGPVSAKFGPITFNGTVTSGKATLSASTQFPWGDGCTWQSSQTISGVLASGKLAYTYAEKPIKGMSCLPPCSAVGSIDVMWQ